MLDSVPENPDFDSAIFASSIYVSDSLIHGKGLFANTFIPAGSVLGNLEGEYTNTDGDHVLWLDEKSGFLVQCNFRYINHSDAPNAIYYDNLEVCAIKDIRPGEEITHNYDVSQEDI